MKLMRLRTAVLAFGAISLTILITICHAQDPVLKQRPVKQAQPVYEGHYAIDVVVTDKAGKRILGLGPQDFVLSDNKQPQKILTFSSVLQTIVKTTEPDVPTTAPKESMEPAEVLLVVDAVNIGFTQQSYVRDQTIKYLRSNDGKLTAPTRLIIFSSAGIEMQNQATLDGNALADLLDKLGSRMRVQISAMGANGAIERFQLSAQNFLMIVGNEARQPGRKLLLWLGPGWPLIPNTSLIVNESYQARNYDAIVSLLNSMREARMEVFSVSATTDDVSSSLLYQNYLKPVRKKSDADSANLAVQVLAVNSGGRVTDPSNDLAGQIARCVDDANSYYTLRFTPSESGKPLTYHSIDVKVNRPGLVARAIAGYYEGP
jgi:VWFA-related protein